MIKTEAPLVATRGAATSRLVTGTDWRVCAVKSTIVRDVDGGVVADRDQRTPIFPSGSATARGLPGPLVNLVMRTSETILPDGVMVVNQRPTSGKTVARCTTAYAFSAGDQTTSNSSFGDQVCGIGRAAP